MFQSDFHVQCVIYVFCPFFFFGEKLYSSCLSRHEKEIGPQKVKWYMNVMEGCGQRTGHRQRSQ